MALRDDRYECSECEWRCCVVSTTSASLSRLANGTVSGALWQAALVPWHGAPSWLGSALAWPRGIAGR